MFLGGDKWELTTVLLELDSPQTSGDSEQKADISGHSGKITSSHFSKLMPIDLMGNKVLSIKKHLRQSNILPIFLLFQIAMYCVPQQVYLR